MASKGKLDEVDRRILRDLQADGRITNVDLAKRIGISAPPCLRRVRALEEKEIIRGYHADIQAEALGYTVMVFAFVGLLFRLKAIFRSSRNLSAIGPKSANVTCLSVRLIFCLRSLPMTGMTSSIS